MADISFRKYIRRQYRRSIQRSVDLLSDADLRQSAIVFSPHQDDETLGCGGAIIKKRALDASVQIVYLTDGSGSHPHFADRIAPAELSRIRAAEAISACGVLGVPAEDISFLNLPDGQLWQVVEPAVEKITSILRESQPRQIFLPYEHDQTPDHLATRSIVLKAIHRAGLTVSVCEYAVWSWHLWPWTNPLNSIQVVGKKQVIVNDLNGLLGLRLLRDFNRGLDITDVLPVKRAALEEHKTQMTRFVDDAGWLTLADASDGEFLQCIFQPLEIYRGFTPGV